MLHKSRLSLHKGGSKKGSSEGLWAISYADFLMVLLSFFIIFFSVDSKNPSTVSNIILDLQKIGSGAESEDQVVPSQRSGNKETLNSIYKAFDGEYVVDRNNNEKVVLKMPDNIFGPSDYSPPVKFLEKIIKLLAPHKNDVYIKVIGHSDTISFVNKGTRVVNNNLTLSSIRASYTANYIKAFYPELKVATEADDQNSRRTRSLTIEISELKGNAK